MGIIIFIEFVGELLPIDYACRVFTPPLVSDFAPFPEDRESGATLDQANTNLDSTTSQGKTTS